MSNNVLENIARENFRSSGYISHPKRERRTSWIFSRPPSSPHSTDAVSGALQRRENALHRQSSKPTFIQTCLNAFFHR
ncbi:MAG: hypothetical protein ACN4GF_02810 [Lentimonas sp.]